ncbi:MAG: CAAX prenyl protease-related protein [Methylococcaceae bacterium]|nr:CAAX prenyl protease-related protein [Methylococcaceae bacterium]
MNSKLDVLAIALLAPWLAQIASLMITSALTNDFDLFYPMRICLISAVLFRYRHTYRAFALNWSWEAPLMGVLVFIIWIGLEDAQSIETYLLIDEINKLPSIYVIAWMFFRIAGSVLIIPLAEEFAFRGYLIRKLVSTDFENVTPQTFTALSFIGSSLIFGLLHDRWFAGVLAGMGYAFVLYRHGRIGDAIVAHMTTNALIAVSVLAFGKWSLWQ